MNCFVPFVFICVALIWGGTAFFEAAVEYDSNDNLAFYVQWAMLFMAGLFMAWSMVIRARKAPNLNYRQKAREAALISVWIAVFAIVLGMFTKLPGLAMTIAASLTVFVGTSAASAVITSYEGRKAFYTRSAISTFLITAGLTFSVAV